MKTIQAIRRDNARQLMREAGGPASFAALIGREPPYVSHILGSRPTKGIGGRMARHIEQCVGKPTGWLDQDRDTLPEASLADAGSSRAFVTLSVAHIETNDTGGSAVVKKGEVGGVPKTALDRLGITEDDALIVEVHGDAHGATLPDGSLVAINTRDTEPREGKTYALRDCDMLRVRVLVPQPGGGMILRTHNREEYPDEHLSANQVSERLEILGRVFWSATAWH